MDAIYSEFGTHPRPIWFQGHWGFQYYMEGKGARAVDFPIQGHESVPELVAWIERAGHEVVPAEGDLYEAVREGDLPLAIKVDSLFLEDFARGVPARVDLIVDNSKSENSALVRRVRQVLQGYSSQLTTLRLMARGVSPEAVRTWKKRIREEMQGSSLP